MKKHYMTWSLTVIIVLVLSACGKDVTIIQPIYLTQAEQESESSSEKLSSEADPALKQETTAALLERILSSDILWQSAEKSGSVFFGPYEQWRETLPELRELETREDAPELLLQEYAYLMEDYYDPPRDLSTPALRYRSTAVITILYQPCFSDRLPKEQREDFMAIAENCARAAEEQLK